MTAPCWIGIVTIVALASAVAVMWRRIRVLENYNRFLKNSRQLWMNRASSMENYDDDDEGDPHK